MKYLLFLLLIPSVNCCFSSDKYKADCEHTVTHADGKVKTILGIDTSSFKNHLCKTWPITNHDNGSISIKYENYAYSCFNCAVETKVFNITELK